MKRCPHFAPLRSQVRGEYQGEGHTLHAAPHTTHCTHATRGGSSNGGAGEHARETSGKF
jgi:hypothetical protein